MLTSLHKQKLNLGIKVKKITFLEDNTREYLHNFGVRIGYINEMKKTLSEREISIYVTILK